VVAVGSRAWDCGGWPSGTKCTVLRTVFLGQGGDCLTFKEKGILYDAVVGGGRGGELCNQKKGRATDDSVNLWRCTRMKV